MRKLRMYGRLLLPQGRDTGSRVGDPGQIIQLARAVEVSGTWRTLDPGVRFSCFTFLYPYLFYHFRRPLQPLFLNYFAFSCSSMTRNF